jgi:Flp pilus assembly protein TadB
MAFPYPPDHGPLPPHRQGNSSPDVDDELPRSSSFAIAREHYMRHQVIRQVAIADGRWLTDGDQLPREEDLLGRRHLGPAGAMQPTIRITHCIIVIVIMILILILILIILLLLLLLLLIIIIFIILLLILIIFLLLLLIIKHVIPTRTCNRGGGAAR